MAGEQDIPIRSVKRLRPLAVIRALKIETQLRTIDAVVPVGRRAQIVRRMLPATLRPQIAGLDVDLDPDRSAERINAGATRR